MSQSRGATLDAPWGSGAAARLLGALAGGIVLALVVTWTAPAAAQPPPESMNRAAWQLYQDGVKALSQSRWAEACDAFLGAWVLERRGAIAGSLGACEYKLGRHRDAAEHLAIYVREIQEDKTATAAQRDAAQAAYYDARAKVGAVPVVVSPNGAAVLVDGKEVGTAPLADPVFLEPGEHLIEARRKGYTAKKATVVAKAGGMEPLTLWLDPAAAAPVRRDAAMAGTRPEERSWMPVAVLGATSAVGLGVAVGLTAAANGASDDAEAQRDRLVQIGGRCVDTPPAYVDSCSELSRRTSRTETLGNAARIAYIASGALAVSAVAVALWPRRSTGTTVRVSALADVGAGAGGVVVLGVW